MKHKYLLSASIALTACSAWASRASADLTIASHGKRTFTIVIPANAPTSIQDAATELQHDVQIAIGAKMPIEKDSQKISAPVISLVRTDKK